MRLEPLFSPLPMAFIGSSWPAWLLVLYCLAICLASLAGGFAPVMLRLTHRRLQVIISLVAGLMLGVGLFHMLPHAIHETGSVDRGVWWMMIGMLTMFFLLRAFHFHQHGSVESDGETQSHGHHHHDHDHGHDHAHDHDHDHRHDHPQPMATPSHPFSWLGIAFGLAIHTLIDGVALATSVQADAAMKGANPWILGLPAFAAILLHKPLDAASITSLMAAGGWPPAARHLINGAFALMVPVGALCFLFGIGLFESQQHAVVGCALAFSAGVFLCIALGDLLPEIEFHAHDRLLLSVALLSGVALAYAIGFLEPAHQHDHGPPSPATTMPR